MGSHGHYGQITPVRYDRTMEEFLLRCDDCVAASKAAYWPLTLEYWNPASLKRCRACGLVRRARLDRERTHADPEWKRKYNRAYGKANKNTINLKRRHRKAEQRRLALTALAVSTATPDPDALVATAEAGSTTQARDPRSPARPVAATTASGAPA